MMLSIIERDFTDELLSDPHLQSEHTRRGYSSDLSDFSQWADGREANKILVESFAAELLQDGYAPATVNRKLAAIRWAANRAVDIVLDSGAPVQGDFVGRMSRLGEVRSVRGERPPAGREIPPGELAALMRLCQGEDSPAGTRDAAIIATLRATGMRRAELCAMTMADIRSQDDEIELTIHGKGNKIRTATLFDGAKMAMDDWLAVRGDSPGAVFCAINKGGNGYPGRQLSGEAVRQILDKRIKQAGIPHLTAHDFRRSLVSGLLDQNIDLVVISKVCGHASVNTTARYDRRPDQRRKDAVKGIFIPYFD